MQYKISPFSARTAALLLCLVMAAAALMPLPALGQEAGRKLVRVGWYESPFNRLDAFGRRSGYAYEYQQKLAAYTGWDYEYVEGSWPDLLQMLIAGGDRPAERRVLHGGAGGNHAVSRPAHGRGGILYFHRAQQPGVHAGRLRVF